MMRDVLCRRDLVARASVISVTVSENPSLRYRQGRPRMKDVLAGIKVVEVAAWTFVPISGAVLSEWGADVIKIEPPKGGDPQRGLVTSGLTPGMAEGNFMFEGPNRGKRSVALDLSQPDGRELL